jgi:hypothetical protein
MAGALGEEIASTNVRAEAAAFAKAAIILLLGVGALSHFSPLGWLLTAIPIIGIWTSYKNLTSRERQALLAAQFLAETNRVALAKAIEAPVIITTAPSEPPAPPTPGE